MTSNVTKTKELIVDFSKNKRQNEDIKIKDVSIQQVDKYKYLGVTINNKLTWNDHLEVVAKKVRQRIFSLYKLNKFGVNKNINLFYKAVIQNLLTYAITCWKGNMTAKLKHRLDSII